MNVSATLDPTDPPSPGPTPPPQLEHFKCYKLKKKRFENRTVTLTDQFQSRRAKVTSRKELCNPVEKNGEALLNESAHLTAYGFKKDKKVKPLGARVVTSNQFGQQNFVVKKPKRLLVPTEKTEDLDGTPPPIETPIDHFQCYRVKKETGTQSAERKPKRVDLNDQFREGRAKVKKPFQLCAPVDKDNGGILDPVDHLLCYKIKEKKIRREVKIQNQFEPTKRIKVVKRPHSVCLPTEKSLNQT